MILFLLQGITLGISAVATPGPYLAYVVSQALQHKWNKAVRLAFAPFLSDGPIIAIVLLLLTHLPSQVLHWLQIIGGFFLLYLAYGAYKDFRSMSRNSDIPTEPSNPSIIKAALINFLSPSPYIFWSLISGPILLKAWHVLPAYGVIFLGGFYSCILIGYILLIILFSSTRRLGEKVNHVLLGITAAALLIFGLYQIWNGVVLVS
jgi:threonine/homoserine/homoserine lactone efflux protein